jgi:hypothetical protein
LKLLEPELPVRLPAEEEALPAADEEALPDEAVLPEEEPPPLVLQAPATMALKGRKKGRKIRRMMWSLTLWILCRPEPSKLSSATLDLLLPL